MTFGQLMHAFRKRTGITQIQLAKTLKISQATVCKIEKDQVDPKASVFMMMAALARDIGKTDETPFDRYFFEGGKQHGKEKRKSTQPGRARQAGAGRKSASARRKQGSSR